MSTGQEMDGGRARVLVLEDRAKAVVDWAGAGFTHQRSGRISVDPDEGRELVGAEEPSSKGQS